MNRFAVVAAMSTALLIAACGNNFTAAVPPEFVEVENDYDSYDFRATTADGLVLAVRQIDHDPKGNLAFWTRAVENTLRDRGGYALLEKHAVENVQGHEGMQLRFGHDEQSAPHLYYVTIFVTDGDIFVLEAGGTKELMERHTAQIEWSVRNFHID